LSALVLVALTFWLVLVSDDSNYALRPFVVPAPEPRCAGIPRRIIQTHNGSLPFHVDWQFESFAAGIRRDFFDDAAAESYISTHFGEPVATTYRVLRGAHRADLFRYCILYREGGLYLDAKTVLCVPLRLIFDALDERGVGLATALSAPVVMVGSEAQVYQGVLFAQPGQPVLLDCIQYIVQYWWRSRLEYFALLRNITARLRAHFGPLRPGTAGELHLFVERWTFWSPRGAWWHRSRKTKNFSRIESSEGEVLFMTRYPDYPWSPRRVAAAASPSWGATS
jgi:hypothetical protein